MLSMLTRDAQVCVIIVLSLLIILASGWIGWRMGWDCCVEYMMRHVDMKMKRIIEEANNEGIN